MGFAEMGFYEWAVLAGFVLVFMSLSGIYTVLKTIESHAREIRWVQKNGRGS